MPKKEMSTPQQQLNRPPSIGSRSSSVHNNNNNNTSANTPVDLDDDDDYNNNNNSNNNLNTSNNNFSTTIHSIIQNSTVLNTSHRNSIMISGLNISKLEEEISALDDSIMLNNNIMTTTTTAPPMMSNMSFLYGGPPDASVSSSSPRSQSILSSSTTNMIMPARPRRLWTIRDTKVPTFPLFYPKPSKQTSTYIRSYPDTPPSTIAIRISECLLARSIITDYDDEAVTATCLTIDRCLFVIHIWKVPKPSKTNTNTNQLLYDKDDLLIECVRTKGNCFAFHRATRAILLAAHGLDSGKDKRNTIQSSLLEYPRFVSSAPTWTTTTSTSRNRNNVINTSCISTSIGAGILSPRTPNILNVSQYSSKLVDESAMMASLTSTSSSSFMMKPPPPTWEVLKPIHPLKPTEVIDKVQESMDTIITMLKKDRLQPQLHGMEMLVSLTDPYCVGHDIALHASLCILGRTSSSTSTSNNTKNISNIRSSPGRVSSLMSGTIGNLPTTSTAGLSPTSDVGTNVTVHCNTTSEAVAVAAQAAAQSSSSSSMDEIQKKWIFEVIVHRRLPTETPIDGCPITEFDYDTMNNSFTFNNCTNSLASIENPMVLVSSSTTAGVAAAITTNTAKIPITTKTTTAPSLQLRQPGAGVGNFVDTTTTTTPMDVAGSPNDTPGTTGIDNEDHGGKIRLLALRVLVNALCNLSKYQDIVLESILSVQCPLWISDSMLYALSEDIHKGCCRPVQVVHSTRLASQHEATICCRIIRILILHNKNLKQRIIQQQQVQQNKKSNLEESSSSLIQYLELARNIGKSTHTILAQEAHEIYQLLTEDDRSV